MHFLKNLHFMMYSVANMLSITMKKLKTTLKFRQNNLILETSIFANGATG